MSGFTAGPPHPVRTGRPTQADRRSRSRQVLLLEAARLLGRVGYDRLTLADVATRAGLSRGAIYHQFDGKDGLVLAVVAWIRESWWTDVGAVLSSPEEPWADRLLTSARRHAIYCRQDVGTVMQLLSLQFPDPEHPVGRALGEVVAEVTGACARAVEQGRQEGSVPPGPPAAVVAEAYLGALEGVTIAVAAHPDHDEVMAERVARGVLGLGPAR